MISGVLYVCVCVCVVQTKRMMSSRDKDFLLLCCCALQRGERERKGASERADRDPDFSRFLTQFLNARITQKVTTGQEQVLISYQRATRYSPSLPPHFHLSNDRAESSSSRCQDFFSFSFNIVFFFSKKRK